MSNQIEYDEIVVCLFDGDFSLGIAGLANSLAKQNFKGLINVGYRGKLPPWLNQLKNIRDNNYYLTNEIIIHFKEVFTNMHLGYYKPFFIKDTFKDYPSTSKFYYFDADIIISAPWDIFSTWLNEGVCLCLDNSYHFIPHNHPWRKDWIKFAPTQELNLNESSLYFNSGFIAIERASVALIERWIYYTEKYIEMGGNINGFDKAPYSSWKGDQDLLNAAVTISDEIQINAMGKEAMGFSLPATLMLHAIGIIKPWNKNFILYLIKYGQKPNASDKAYFTHCKFIIKVFSPFTFRINKINLSVATFLGRFLG